MRTRAAIATNDMTLSIGAPCSFVDRLIARARHHVERVPPILASMPFIPPYYARQLPHEIGRWPPAATRRGANFGTVAALHRLPLLLASLSGL